MEQGDKNEARRIMQINCFYRYGLSLIITISLTFCYVEKYPEPKEALNVIHQALIEFVTGHEQSEKKVECPEMPVGAANKATPEVDSIRLCKIEKNINERLHGKPEAIESLIKNSIVISISFLWFFTFQFVNLIKDWVPLQEKFRWKTWPVVVAKLMRSGYLEWEKEFSFFKSISKWISIILAIGVPVLFALSMFKVYEPAVFVMALVAIFVAAEHYGGLMETERQTEELKDAVEHILNADGLNEWRKELYELYGKATMRIDAVIRHFDIDDEWWRCTKTDDPWGEYERFCDYNSQTLLSVVGRCKAKIQFVSELPLPIFEDGTEFDPRREKYFYDFLGLAWQLVVFGMVRSDEKRNKKFPANVAPPPCVKISTAASWMHVVDDTIFQVVERGLTESPTVRRLTRDIRDGNSKATLVDWARCNVRQFGHRGGYAEEYVFSVLSLESLKLFDEDMTLNSDRLKVILQKIGMDDFIRKPIGNLLFSDCGGDCNGKRITSFKDAEKLCIAVFQRLIDDRYKENICSKALGDSSAGLATIQKIAHQVV